MVSYLRSAVDWLKDFGFAIKDTLSSLDEPEEIRPQFHEPSNVVRYWDKIMEGFYRERKIKILEECRSNGQESRLQDLADVRNIVRSHVLGIINNYVAERSKKGESVVEGDLGTLVRDILRNPEEDIRKGKQVSDYIDGMFDYEKENSERILL